MINVPDAETCAYAYIILVETAKECTVAEVRKDLVEETKELFKHCDKELQDEAVKWISKYNKACKEKK